MKETLIKVFSDSEKSLQNKTNCRTYIEYDSASNRINDGSGYIEPPYEDLEIVGKDGGRMDFIQYHTVINYEISNG